MDEIKTILPTSPSLSASQAKAQAEYKKLETLAKTELKHEQEVDNAASGFEALLLHNMLKEMWKSVEFTGFLGGDSNEAQIYRDMLNQAIADSVSEGEGIGIKEFLKKELVKVEGASKATEK